MASQGASIRHFVAVLLFLPLIALVPALPAQSLWRDVDEAAMLAALPAQQATVARRNIVPEVYRTLELDLPALAARLQASPRETAASRTDLAAAGVEITLPLPYGGFGRFRVLESPVMEEALARRYPELRTFVAQGVDDPGATARLDLSPRGLRAMVLSARGQFLIDPYWRSANNTTHIAYYARHQQLREGMEAWTCRVEAPNFDPGRLNRAFPPNPERPSGTTLRVFRMAVATTGEYASAVLAGAPGGKGAVLASIVTAINRVNLIYERELAVRFILVAKTDALIFTDGATDGYTDSDNQLLLDENQAKCDAIIGTANYDIGHVFCSGGGGRAQLASVCQAGAKARAASGSQTPAEDSFSVRVLCHELGHQFGANHTFNGSSGGCQVNINAATAYEPGSGSTLLGYAPTCAPQNVTEAGSDDYFHLGSYLEMDVILNGFASCPQPIATGNTPPRLAPLANRVIPSGTPFALTGSATDPDGDSLTYCWEEFDLGPQQDPTGSPRDNGSSPLFRSRPPSQSPTRLFPALATILAGTSDIYEALPTTNRTMNFRLSVRDNRAGGGGFDYATMTVQSVLRPTPFAVTSPSGAATIAAGTAFPVSWNVAGTDANGINCASVNIRFSTDGGLTFPISLAAGVPNNGSASVTIPNLPSSATSQGRLKVEAAGNIFFALNNAHLTVTASGNTAPTLPASLGTLTVTRGGPAIEQNVGTVSNGTAPFNVAVDGVPLGATIVAGVNAGGVIQVSAQADCRLASSYALSVVITDSLGATARSALALEVMADPAPVIGSYPALTALARGTVRLVTPYFPPRDSNGNLPPTGALSISPTTLPGGGSAAIDALGNVTLTTSLASAAVTTNLTVILRDRCGVVSARQFDVQVTAAVVAAPVIAAVSAPLQESCTPANGVIDPNEFVSVAMTVRNDGLAPATALVGTLQAAGGVQPLGQVAQNFGTLAPGASASRTFSFRASGSCGGSLQPVLQFQDGATSLGNASTTLALGSFQPGSPLVENFDSSGASLPAGWATTIAPGSSNVLWSSITSPNHTAPRAVAVSRSGATCDSRLDTPAILLAPGPSTLRFYHSYSLPIAVGPPGRAYDGGVLEVSFDGGAFEDITVVGGSFVQGGYTHTVAEGVDGTPLPGRLVWSGNLNTYQQVIANLPSSNTFRMLRLRFRLGGGTGSVSNWRIDTLELIGQAAVCATCGPADPPTAVALTNPSLELDNYTSGTGYANLNGGAITGWTLSDPARIGLNPAATSPFANNGAVPDGTRVAFVQSTGGTASTLSTTLPGLTVGGTYQLRFRANVRSGTAAAAARLLVGGLSAPFEPNPAVGGTAPYRNFERSFIAYASSSPLALTNQTAADSTLLLDDFRAAAVASPWRAYAWTDDASTRLGPDTLWAHALNSAAGTTVNGVTVDPTAGVNPSVAGRFALTGYGSATTDTNNLTTLTGTGSVELANSFVFGGNPGTLTLSGLTAGKSYTVSIFTVGFDAVSGARVALFSSGADAVSADVGTFGDNNGLRLEYTFTATGPTRAITIAAGTASTFHLYALALRPAALPAVFTGANTDAPNLRVNGDTFAFPEAGALQTFTVQNATPFPLTRLLATVSGPNAVDFALETGLNSATLAPGATATFSVRFQPTQPGARAATVSLGCAESSAVFLIPLSGTTNGPQVTVSTSAIVRPNGFTEIFAETAPGSSSPPVAVTVENTGNAPLTGLALSLGSALPGEFVISSGLGATTLAPGASTTFAVQFAPTAGGTRSATVTLLSDAGAPFELNLFGSAGLPDIAVFNGASTAPLNERQSNSGGQVFNLANLGGSAGTATFTIRNSGTAPLTGLAVTRSGAGSAQFNVTQPAASSLAAGGTTTFTVNFIPVNGGVQEAVIAVASNDPDEPSFLIPVRGTGNAPEISVYRSASLAAANELASNAAPTALSAPALGQAGAAQTFTVWNVGRTTLSGLALSFSGAHAAEFAVSALGLTSLAPQASATFTVTFTPAAAGSRTARVSIASNDANENPFELNLEGQVALSALQAWRQLYFGTTDNAGPAADTFDADLDGVPNLAEFAFGLDPLAAKSAQLPPAVLAGGLLTYTYNPPDGVSGVTVGAEFATALAPGNWQPVPNSGVAPQKIFSVPASGQPQIFLRWKVTAP